MFGGFGLMGFWGGVGGGCAEGAGAEREEGSEREGFSQVEEFLEVGHGEMEFGGVGRGRWGGKSWVVVVQGEF